jgi:hypothetical protein
MKTPQTDRLFTQLSDNEAETINGGDGLSNYINSIAGSIGAYPYIPVANAVVSQDLINAYLQNGTSGQVYYLLDAVNLLSGL